MKDHEMAKLVNDLRDIAQRFHDHQSLRQRIAQRLVPEIDKMRDEWYSPAHMDTIQTRTIDPLRQSNKELDRANVDLAQESRDLQIALEKISVAASLIRVDPAMSTEELETQLDQIADIAEEALKRFLPKENDAGNGN